MLSKISWQEFISFLAIMFAGYYLFILFRFYRKEVFNFLQRDKKRDSEPDTRK